MENNEALKIIETRISYLARLYEWEHWLTVAFLGKRPPTIGAELLGLDPSRYANNLRAYLQQHGYHQEKDTGRKKRAS